MTCVSCTRTTMNIHSIINLRVTFRVVGQLKTKAMSAIFLGLTFPSRTITFAYAKPAILSASLANSLRKVFLLPCRRIRCHISRTFLSKFWMPWIQRNRSIPLYSNDIRVLSGPCSTAPLTSTRPDVAYVVGMLCRAMSYPIPVLLEAAERVLAYLIRNKDVGLRSMLL